MLAGFPTLDRVSCAPTFFSLTTTPSTLTSKTSPSGHVQTKTTWASFVPRTIPKTGPRHSRATRRKIPTTTYLFQNLLLPIPTIKVPVLLYSPPTTTRLHKPHRTRQTKHVVPVLTPVPIKRCCHFDDPMSNPTFCRAFPKKCTLATR